MSGFGNLENSLRDEKDRSESNRLADRFEYASANHIKEVGEEIAVGRQAALHAVSWVRSLAESCERERQRERERKQDWHEDLQEFREQEQYRHEAGVSSGAKRSETFTLIGPLQEIHRAKREMLGIDLATVGIILAACASRSRAETPVCGPGASRPVAEFKLEDEDLSEISEDLPEPSTRARSASNSDADQTAGQRTWIVVQESLASIAERVYHNANVAWLIADLNSERIHESELDGKRIVRVRLNGKLALPFWSEVERFCRRPDSIWLGANLVTLLEDAPADSGRIDASLGKILGVE